MTAQIQFLKKNSILFLSSVYKIGVKPRYQQKNHLLFTKGGFYVQVASLLVGYYQTTFS